MTNTITEEECAKHIRQARNLAVVAYKAELIELLEGMNLGEGTSLDTIGYNEAINDVIEHLRGSDDT